MTDVIGKRGPVITRRSAMGLFAAAGMSVIAGCSSNSSSSTTSSSSAAASSSSSTPTLVISTWGFNAEQKRSEVYAPFEKLYNCKIVTDEGNNGDRLSKLQQQPEAYDVVMLSDYYAQQAADSGLFTKIDQSKLTNLSGVYERAKAPNGTSYGPAFTFNRMGIIYDKSVVKTPITSWADLWRSDLANLVALPDYSTTVGPMMLNIAAGQLGLTLSADNADKAFAKLAEMKGNVVKFYTKSSDVINMFNQGEVSVAVLQDFSSLTLQQASNDFVWVDPSEGTWGCRNTTNISAKSKQADLALKFVDYTIDKDEQQRNIVTGDAPTRPDVTLTDDQAKAMPYGEAVVNAIQYPDLELLLANTKTWADTWNKQLNTSK